MPLGTTNGVQGAAELVKRGGAYALGLSSLQDTLLLAWSDTAPWALAFVSSIVASCWTRWPSFDLDLLNLVSAT